MDRQDSVISLPVLDTPAHVPAERWTSRLAAASALAEWWDAVPTFMLATDEQGRVVFANQSFCRFLGVERREMLYGRVFGDMVCCSHSLAAGCGASEACQHCDVRKALTRMSQPSVQEYHLGQGPGQRSMDVRVVSTPIELGGERFMVLALTDISDEKRRQALERVFFHDLLNTAGAVIGYAELLRDAVPEEIPELVAAISRLTGNLADEIRAQQQLAAAERNDLYVRWEPVRSREIISAVAQSYQNHPTGKDRALVLDERCMDVVLASDRVLLSRVLGNMVKNALEASDAGQRVTMGCTADDSEAEFWVHNAGVIPREVQFQIFHRSFSTKGVGRGLGTHSIRLLSERYLKGKVSFSSSPENGTVFRARYPLQRST